MTTLITSTTLTSGYQLLADSTGTLVIQTGSTPTTAMYIDSSQRVGIGTITPSGTLDVANRGITRGSMPIGSVLQVVHTTKTSTFTGTSVLDNGGYFLDVTGLSATITPSLSTSKILVMVTMYTGVSATASGNQQSYRLKRTIGASTAFPILGDAEGGRPRATGRTNSYNTTAAVVTYRMVSFAGTHQDTPGVTSAITYQVQLGGYTGSTVVYLNRAETFQFSANDYDTVPVSTMTLMEIAV